MGATVYDTSPLGGGFPDIVVGWQGQNYLIEIKNGELPASRTKLTEAEQEFSDVWRGQYAVVYSVDDALRLFKR